jgi:hypothetical protein
LQAIVVLSARTHPPEVVDQIVEDSLSEASAAKLTWQKEWMLEDLSTSAAEIRVPTLATKASERCLVVHGESL